MPTSNPDGPQTDHRGSIDRLATLINTEDPKYAKLRQEDLKDWETGV